LRQVDTISLTEPANQTTVTRRGNFRLTYILLPVGLLLAAIILAVVFYNKLPPEVAYHFIDDTPDGWISRGAITVWLVTPQFVLALIGIALSGIGSVITRKNELPDRNRIMRILMAMGNMVALPQLILIFALLDIFLYNAYQIRLIPLWAVIIAVLFIGSIILGIFFLQTLRQPRGADVKNHRE
jgi:uncharacterized membrane protein